MIDLIEHYKAVRQRIEKGQPRVNLVAREIVEPKPALKKEAPIERPPMPRPRFVPNFRNAREIVEPILISHNKDWNEVASPVRRQNLVLIRREIMVALRRAGWTLPMIGKFMNRDHTTVLHALKSWEKQNAD